MTFLYPPLMCNMISVTRISRRKNPRNLVHEVSQRRIAETLKRNKRKKKIVVFVAYKARPHDPDVSCVYGNVER
jgi:hypothetical protein